MKPNFLLPILTALLTLALPAAPAHASQAYGSINNFDCVNDTGVECHGFEIEIEDIHSRDVTYTFNWNHYGTPAISEDNSNPLHPRVLIRYASARNPDGSWAAYTAIPSGPILATDGHQFTNPSTNFGGEHFGAGFAAQATNITYHWLVDNGGGVLVRGPAVMVSTPVFSYFPPAGGQPAQVQAVIPAPEAPEVHVLEFGPPSWVKEIRTTSHNHNAVRLRDLVSDDPDDPDDRNWRNGEPDEVETEWRLLQEEFNKRNGGRNGELEGAPEDLPDGDEVITRRYEFYRYIGPLDNETGEAMAENVGPDGIHGVGVKEINGVEVDLSTVAIVGEYLGSQMAAVDVAALVGLIEHVQDGVANEPYPTRTLVIGGAAPFTATNWGALPTGMTFDLVSGELSGTPADAGVFQFTVEARTGTNPPVRKTYTLTIAEPGEELPPRSTVDTVPSPLHGGATGGDGSYTSDTPATVTAIPAPGFAFANWTEQGRIVSRSPFYTFINRVNRSLEAHFVPGPTLEHRVTLPATLTLSWSTNFPGWRLQESPDLDPASWAASTRPVSVVGQSKQVTVTPLPGVRFFRLTLP